MPRPSRTTADFINISNSIHDNKYDYSETIYINNSTKVKIICKIHGVFEKSPNKHISAKQGCPSCSKSLLSRKFVKPLDIFTTQANNIHNNMYDYSETVYMNSKTKVKILCKTHGEFYQTPTSHLNGSGCYHCGCMSTKLSLLSNTTNFVTKSKEIHGSKYTYDNVEYINSQTKVQIYCNLHGHFLQTPNNHLRGQECPHCAQNISKGELTIKSILTDNNISFIQEYRFDDCKYNKTLPFDFYIPQLNTCIEFDGKQHFKPIQYFGGEEAFIKQQIKDNIKDEYCRTNNIRLLRIPYTEFNNIKQIIKTEFDI